MLSGSGREWRTIAPYSPYSAMMLLRPQVFSVLRHLARRFWNQTYDQPTNGTATNQWRIQDFGQGGVKFKKFRPKPPILCNVTVGLQPYTLHEMIEINMKIETGERTPTLGTLSMISLKVDFVNIY